jgi:hypothetical protein
MRGLLFAFALASSTLAGCSKESKESASATKDELPAMSLDQVEQGLAAKQLVAVDCNVDKTRKKHGVLPGAILVADEEAFAQSELPADKSTKLVFYCSGPG